MVRVIFLIILLFSVFRGIFAQCIPYSGQLDIYPQLTQEIGVDQLKVITVAIPKGFNGSIQPATDRFGNPLSDARLIIRYAPRGGFEEDSSDENVTEKPDSITRTVILRPTIISREACEFRLPSNLPAGECRLIIPEGYFEIDPACVEVDELDLPREDLVNLKVTGAWHKPGKEWKHPGLFSFHDDDGIDGMIASSVPGEYTHGYFSLLYPMLESIGVRGCLSLEGRRSGFTSNPPVLNDNGKIARRLQDERGWEIMSHSMKCLGERLNCWAVESIDSPLADIILEESDYAGPSSPNTTAVYSREDGVQYIPNPEKTGWEEVTDPNLIRPYAGNYETRKPILFNDNFNIKYHWGEWFREAEENGINGRTWVMHNAQSSHVSVPAITAECPLGFIDQYPVLYNTPPLMTTAARMLCEGQFFDGPTEYSRDNTYNLGQYNWFRNKIKEAHDKGAWIVMGGHAYRHVWDNYIPGALVSEGGAYPDEWVNPMEGIDPLTDPLTPPVRLGISDWSEWYPCPGTRLRMMWDLLRYAKELGMINVTSSEGFEIIGNKESVGYFTNGLLIGYDDDEFEGARSRQPHYVKGANDEEYYYNRGGNNEIDTHFTISYTNRPQKGIIAYAIDGTYKIVDNVAQLPRGIWFVSRRKFVVK